MVLFWKKRNKDALVVTRSIDTSVVNLKSKMGIHKDGSVSGIPQEFIEEMKRIGYKLAPEELEKLYRLSANVMRATFQSKYMNFDQSDCHRIIEREQQSILNPTVHERDRSESRETKSKLRSEIFGFGGRILVPLKKTKAEKDKENRNDARPGASDLNQGDELDFMLQELSLRNKDEFKDLKRRRNAEPRAKEDIIKILKAISNQYTTVDQTYGSLEFINGGCSGMVYRARALDDNRPVALKIIDFRAQSEKHYLLREILVMRKLQHANIVNFHDCFFENNNLTIVMEFCSGGALAKVCERIEMPEDLISYITDRSFRGLIHLHSQSIIHRDLKSDNILLNLDGGVKIADFGLCAKLKSDNEKHKTQVGSPYWMAPEVINKNSHNYTVDTWSMGIVIIEMYDKDPPYFSMDQMSAMLKITNNKKMPPIGNRDAISASGMDLLRKMLKYEAKERPTLSKLCNHPFLRVGDKMPLSHFTKIVESALNQE
ncbi:MAG: hypothetical protein MHMPM18_000349 [Marteilia pararefringens]